MSLASSFVLSMALLTVSFEDTAPFTGAWVHDVEQSDDPQEKMREAMQQMGPRRGAGRPPGRMGGRGPRGGISPRGADRGGRPELGRVADELDLELDGAELFVDDGEQLRIYYLDGEVHKRETANGTELETVAELHGNAVVIEEKMERGRIDRKLELSPDGETMVVTVTVKLGRMEDPVVIRTVYKRAAEASDGE